MPLVDHSTCNDTAPARPCVAAAALPGAFIWQKDEWLTASTTETLSSCILHNESPLQVQATQVGLCHWALHAVEALQGVHLLSYRDFLSHSGLSDPLCTHLHSEL